MADKERRMVTLCEGTPESTGKLGGRGPRLWAFGYEALAKLFGMTEGAVRQAVYDGRLDPSDLEAVCQSWMRYHESEARLFITHRDAELDHPSYTPEEKEMIERMRAQVATHAREHRLTPEQEVEEMKRRCREAPFLRTGPTPADLSKGQVPPLDTRDPELRGMVLAKCAAGERDEVIPTREVVGRGRLPVPEDGAESLDEYAERLLIAGGFPPEAARVMVKARRGPGPHGPSKEDDPEAPF